MTWKLHQPEIASVLALDGGRRYGYLLHKVADQEEIWSLATSGGWALAALDDSPDQGVPVWPHMEYARLCANGEWDGFEPRTISLGDWMTKWLPGMKRDGRKAIAFPTPTNVGVAVAPDRFLADLKAELDQYE